MKGRAGFTSGLHSPCYPGPEPLTPEEADEDKKQLSLPRSTPHPRGDHLSALCESMQHPGVE